MVGRVIEAQSSAERPLLYGFRGYSSAWPEGQPVICRDARRSRPLPPDIQPALRSANRRMWRVTVSPRHHFVATGHFCVPGPGAGMPSHGMAEPPGAATHPVGRQSGADRLGAIRCAKWPVEVAGASARSLSFFGSAPSYDVKH